MSHHEPLKALGPIDWTAVTGDDLKHFLNTTFLHAQTVVDSIPAATKPQQAGRARSHTDSSVTFDPASRHHTNTSASADASTATAAAHAAKLQKEWKEVKIPPRDNPCSMSVYKLAGKDGRGAWFARRSMHEGISFDKFRLGLEMEFGHTLQHTTGPGTGNIRGIGAERKAEHLECDGVGQADVWLLNAQFPGPTTPRDFVTLFLTGTSGSDDKTRGPRQFMVVSKPCNHPECAPRSAYIRGNYESVELIREVPIEKPLRRVRSSVDMRREDFQLPSRKTGGGMDIGQEAALHAAQKRAETKSDEDPGERGLSRSLTGLPPRDRNEDPGAAKSGEDTEMAIEWVMVTRSDPGGSVPRFMVEKGTPAGIVTDAGKFLRWLETRTEQKLEESRAGIPENPEDESPKNNVNEGTTPRPHQPSTSISRPPPDPSQAAAEGHVQPSGFYNMIAGAIGAASSMVTSRLPGVAHSTSELDSDLQDSESDTEPEASFASAQEPEVDTPLAKVLSGEGVSLGGGDMASMHSTKSDESSTKAAVSHHEKHLKKLQDRHRRIAEKMARQQERASQGKSNQSDDQLAKLKEKHEKEIARQEENYRKEVKKMEEKKLKEERKAEERRRKQQEKDERSNAAMQLEKAQVERDMALKQIDILKDQVGELQAQNTKLVAQLGKLGGLASTNDLAANGMVDGKLSKSSSQSK